MFKELQSRGDVVLFTDNLDYTVAIDTSYGYLIEHLSNTSVGNTHRVYFDNEALVEEHTDSWRGQPIQGNTNHDSNWDRNWNFAESEELSE